MALVVPIGFASVVHRLQLASDPEPMAITYGVQLIGTPTPDDVALQLATAFGEIGDLLPVGYDMTQTEVRCQLAAPPAPPEIGISTLVTAGSEVLSICPQNTAFLVHKRTNQGGRGGRGRMYFPGVPENQVSATGVVEGTAPASWAAALPAWLLAIQTSQDVENMVVLHDSLGAHAADPPASVSTLVLDSRVATQRRRLR